MTFLLLAALLAQPNADAAARELDAVVQQNDSRLDEAFECLDRETKSVLSDTYNSATGDSVVDGALSRCSSVFDAMSNDFVGTSLEDQRGDLTDGSRSRLRSAYLDLVEGWLTKPDFAEARNRIIGLELGQCVRGKIKSWASQSETASTLATAAVNSCQQEWANWRIGIRYDLKAKEQSYISVSDLERGVRERLTQGAVAWVLEERAGS